MQALLGIDLGTTGVKAALFATEDGHVLASAFAEYPLVHPHPGWAEQDPQDWWQATIMAIRNCLAGGFRHGIAPTDIRGVGLSGQMHGVVLLNVKEGTWSQEVLEAIGCDPALLPPVIAADAISGTSTDEVASLTGLPTGIPIAGGGADNACGAVGNGVVRPGLA